MENKTPAYKGVKILTCLSMLMLLIVGIIHYLKSMSSYKNTYHNTPMLIQKGTSYWLYDDTKPIQPNINPVVFTNISEYAIYVDKQKCNGIPYPEIFIQNTIDAQGNDTFILKKDPLNPQTMDYMPIVEGLSYTSIDGSGTKSPYDRKIYMDNIASNISNALSSSQIKAINKLELTKSVLSEDPVRTCRKTPEDINPLIVDGKTADPMTPNWGGIPFTQKLVDDGYYIGNEVIKPPIINSGLKPSGSKG